MAGPSTKGYTAAVKALFRQDPAYPFKATPGTRLCPRCDCTPSTLMWLSKAEALAVLVCGCVCHDALRFGYKGVRP